MMGGERTRRGEGGREQSGDEGSERIEVEVEMGGRENGGVRCVW